MISFLEGQAWNPIWETSAPGRVFVDLTGCRDLPCVLRRLGGTLRGSDSPIIKGNSLDAFIDVLGDWFIDIWGQSAEVYVGGASAIEKLGPRVLANITECFHDAFESASREAIRVGSECSYLEAKKNITIWICFN